MGQPSSTSKSTPVRRHWYRHRTPTDFVHFCSSCTPAHSALSYNRPSAPGAKKEWYSGYGIDNPTLLILPNGSSLLAGRTCSGPEHPWVAASPSWASGYKSIDDNKQPFPMNNAEDPFMWRDKRGNLHMIHHLQDGDHNRYYNGGHSFSRDGTHWTFSKIPVYTKNITWRDGTWTVMGRRERPGLLLDMNWSTPHVLFTSVVHPNGPDSWMQSQPVRSAARCASSGWTDQICNEPAGGGACESDESCNLNGFCQDGKCHCDIEWSGMTCGQLALLPAKKSGGYRRPGFNGWGGNPFWDKTDQRYHVFTVEMTNHCTINDYITNSQVVHAVSADAEGPYQLAPIAGGEHYDLKAGAPAPNASVLVPAFAHAAHATRDPNTGALVIVYEGRHPRDLVPPSKQKRCHYEPP